MHLAREGGAGYNKAMKNYYRVMLGAIFAVTVLAKILQLIWSIFLYDQYDYRRGVNPKFRRTRRAAVNIKFT